MDRSELAGRIFGIANLKGRFRLRSGAESGEYFDKFRFESDPELLGAIVRALAPHVPADAEMLAGLELGGVPLAAVLSQSTGRPAVYVRKAPKEYGTAKQVEGLDAAGKRVLVVEDVVSSGGAILDAVEVLRAEGALVIGALCVIDRQSGGADNLAAAGVPLVSVYTMGELRAAAGVG